MNIWLVVWNIDFIFPYIGLLIIPIDFHIFQRGGPTTNQTCSDEDLPEERGISGGQVPHDDQEDGYFSAWHPGAAAQHKSGTKLRPLEQHVVVKNR